MALEGKDTNEIIKSVLNMLKSCILTKDINVGELPSFDVEYLFLKIREKSMGETLTVVVQCPITDKKFEVELNLNEIKIEKTEKHKNKIQVDENLGLILKYPTFALMQETLTKDTTTSKIFNIITSCIETICDKDKVYNAKDYSKKELQEFLENLPQNTFSKINEFFQTFPKITYEKEFISPHAGTPVKVRLDTFLDFFD